MVPKRSAISLLVMSLCTSYKRFRAPLDSANRRFDSGFFDEIAVRRRFVEGSITDSGTPALPMQSPESNASMFNTGHVAIGYVGAR